MVPENALRQAATIVARHSLRLQPGEKVVLITDTRMDPEVHPALHRALAATGASVGELVVSFDEGKAGEQIAAFEPLANADAVVAAVTRSLSYDRTIGKVWERGGRFLSMPRVNREILERVAMTDVEAMLRLTSRVGDQFNRARSSLELRSPSGTRLSVDIAGCEAHVIDGVVGPGESDQLPAGLVSIVGKHARGDVYVTGGVSLLDRLDEPIRLRVEDSSIVAIEGGESARRLAEILDSFEDRAGTHHCPAEIGIGTNPSIVFRPVDRFVPEMARAVGMVHVGFGDDHLLPGGSVKAPIHGDFLLPDAGVWLDGVKLEFDL